MGVSALRATACAGVLVGGLILGNSAAGVARADPGGWGHGGRDGQSSKGVNERGGRGHAILRHVSEHRKRHHDAALDTRPTTFGSESESGVVAGEPSLGTFSEATEPDPEPEPDLAPGERGADPDGTDGTEPGGSADRAPVPDTGGDGSDYSDDTVAAANTVVSAEPAAEKLNPAIEHPFPFYLLEIRRDGGTWWNANQIISRLGQAIGSYLPAPPEPEPAPGPAFRVGAPEPEPVLDASGGVGGGSDYQPTDFGGAPVLQAPVIAVPVLPAAAARFPSAPSAGGPGPGAGLARGAGVEPASTNSSALPEGTKGSLPAGTVTSMAGQTPRQGNTNYLRTAGLPELAGAALPGIAGILLMTFGGGVIGYRQANAGRMVRTTGAARYLP